MDVWAEYSGRVGFFLCSFLNFKSPTRLLTLRICPFSIKANRFSFLKKPNPAWIFIFQHGILNIPCRNTFIQSLYKSLIINVLKNNKQDVEYPVLDIENPKPDIQYPELDIEYPKRFVWCSILDFFILKADILPLMRISLLLERFGINAGWF